MISLAQLFSFDLWLGSGPLTKNGLVYLLVFFSFLFLFGVVAKFILEKNKDVFIKRLWNKLAVLCLSVSLIGYFFVFFAYQGVLILSLRVWFLFILLIGLMWGFKIWKYWNKIVPEQKRKMVSQLVKEKYL